ncbi:putative nuclease HARBI1 [Sinocyclocheilus anshuiensis]|uniref:putative nuclease HARBI1 n=1 Tax=Sinocyclocheilus anshuiensis TaxID=1608454 RepID=UPI0007B8999F|nr:PREDICTED: putative nuclease HARBI1 [Sinocyclocheilus anshuiensis]
MRDENDSEIQTEEKDMKRYRFSKESVMRLNQKIEPAIRHGSDRNAAIPPMLQLLTALRFYATGCFQMVDGDLFGVHKSTVSRIVGRVSQAIAALKNQYIRFAPTGETSAGFYRRAGFPGVIGAIDCTHIPIQNPGGENGELFRNRKGYCSINVQVVCDEKVQIINIVARWPGSTHDSRIFDNSHLCALLESHAFQGHLVGDNGYPCRAYLLTPILNPSTPAEKRYNTCHIAARGLVERVFGVWKKRFPCLQNGLRTKLDTTLAVIVALAVLYNFGKRLGDEVLPEFEVDYRIEHTEDEGEEHNAATANGNAVRRTLIENHFTA